MSIDDWRKKIDELDAQLVELLNARSRCAAEIGKLKAKDGQPIYSPEREQEILERVQQLNRGPLGNDALKRLFERILDEAAWSKSSRSTRRILRKVVMLSPPRRAKHLRAEVVQR